MVVFEEIAAPFLLFIHVMSALLGLALWIAGIVLMVRGIKTGN